MKLLVTGGAGFIGSNFIHYWLKNYPSDEIINLDLLTYAGNLDNLQDISTQANYQFVKGDIVDANLVNSLVPKIDLIVHFAAESHVDRSILDSARFIRTNIEGTRVLLEAARKNNTHFHHISTDEVFGSLGFGSKKFSEQSPYNPHSPYSASKAAADHLVRAYFYTYNLPITISNCSNNYGPYQYPEKIIPLFITNLLNNQSVPIYGNGDNIRDWIQVDDHIRGIDLIINKGKIGETYCLGSNNEYSNLQITKLILKLMGQSEEKIQHISDRLGHDRRYAIDFSKAQKELGWEPRVDFESGLRATIDWYTEHEVWWKKIKVNK